MHVTAHNSDCKFERVRITDLDNFHTRASAFITINPFKKHQEIQGIGAAITDASAQVFSSLPKQKQEEFLENYFCPVNGMGYSLLRTTINSCDFSPASFTYVDEGDSDLSTFNIKPDLEERIPMIRAAMRWSEVLTIYASPWSPPAFMKSNGSMLNGGSLLPQYREAWANYFVRFIQEYEKNGIPIWGVTVQNEPAAKQVWESCLFTDNEELEFVRDHLGPAFAKAELSSKKIIIWDHNRDEIFQRANTILSDPKAAQYVWGTGFHWYEDWKDGKPMFENVAKVNEAFPYKQLIFTEGCNERFDSNRLEQNDPTLAERYAVAMINDFNNGAAAWTDWNILLDHKGGPNHVGNFCFAPTHTSDDCSEVEYTFSYYYIGHFSKFIRPGAYRVSSASSSNELLVAAFVNPDQSLVSVICNLSDEEHGYQLDINGIRTTLSIPAHALKTIVFDYRDIIQPSN
jgi:glucosylceramidase